MGMLRWWKYGIGILGLGLLCACENDINKVAALGHAKNLPEEAHGVDAYFYQGGVLKARLLAPYMLRYTDTLTVFPQTLHVDFYDTLQRIESRLDADYGDYHERRNLVYLRDHVKIVNLVKKDTILCEDLYWDQNTGKFYTHRKVEIHEPTQTIYGRGMNSTQDFSNVNIDTVTNSPIRVQGEQLP
jgi:LPS export ABC transporter protein LptC